MPEIEKLTLNNPETQSADIVAGNVAALQALFPEAFIEGRVDFDVLKQVLGGAIDDREEKYGLNWHGKRRARQIALTPSTGTLLPCPQDSVDWDATQNLMIEGDNLEVLKLLQKSYAGKVKMIYIDPPYNTGRDFVYPDDYRDGIRNYLEVTGQVSGGNQISSNTESSGRFHTEWLNMIFPRLKVARSLLADDGFLFISVDDGEISNARKLCDDTGQWKAREHAKPDMFGQKRVLLADEAPFVQGARVGRRAGKVAMDMAFLLSPNPATSQASPTGQCHIDRHFCAERSCRVESRQSCLPRLYNRTNAVVQVYTRHVSVKYSIPDKDIGSRGRVSRF